MRTALLLTALVLTGCEQSSTTFLNGTPWDPDSVVATDDGLYAQTPINSGLLHITTDGVATPVDLGDAQLLDLSVTPSQTQLMATVREIRCDEPDEKEAKKQVFVSDCPEDQQVMTDNLVVIDDGAVTLNFGDQVKGNSFLYSPDARFAMAWFDSRNGAADGIVNLAAVEILDLQTGDVTITSLGVQPSNVLFTSDTDGTVNGAVILAQSKVMVVNIDDTGVTRETTYNLTLDPDTVVSPVDAVITPEGTHALVALNQSDLFVLDLENPSINILELAGIPNDLAVDPSTNRTLVTLTSVNAMHIVDHDPFEVTTVVLDEWMNNIEVFNGQALLSRAGSRDAYLLDNAVGDWTEYRFQNSSGLLQLSPNQEFAAGFSTSTAPAMEVLDFRDDAQVTPFALEQRGLGMEWIQSAEDRLDLYVLQENVDYLYRLDVFTNLAQEIELADIPRGFGRVPDGPLYTTHDDPLGLISLFDPATGDRTDVVGFATVDWFEPIRLATTEVE